MRGTLVFIPENGLCNRIRSVASAKKLAETIGSDLKVMWMRDNGFNTRFSDLFEPMEAMELFDHSQASLLVEKYQQALLTRSSFGFVQKWAMGRYSHVLEHLTNGELVDPNLIEDLKGKQVLISSCDKFYPSDSMDFSIFKPKQKLLNSVHEFARENFNGRTLGVHVRRGDHTWSITESSNEKFIATLDAFVSSGGASSFFLATDSPEVETLLGDRYKDKICFRKKDFSRYTTTGIEDAIIDLYLLSKTREVIGSYWSSYSITATEIGKIPLHTVQ